MTLSEIKQVIGDGKRVFWKNRGYEVIFDGKQYLIKCHFNDSYIGLTWRDGVTMNGKEDDFVVEL